MLPPPPWLPFIEYVLMSLEHPPDMFVSHLAACCTMLFLTRSDPDLLRALCHKWAIRFARDRALLLRRIHRRVQGSGASLHAAGSTDSVGSSSLPPGPQLCDPDECVEHFLKLINTLVPLYFSWNWHLTKDVININKEYEAYIRQNILPMCLVTDPEESICDEEEPVALFPRHLMAEHMEQIITPTVELPRSHFYKEAKGDPSDFHVFSFVTIGNLLQRIRDSHNGLVLIFHARFSTKSCEALNIFRIILNEQLLRPVPKVSVVNDVAEPELANMFNISWFPTIIYIPPLSVDEMNNNNNNNNNNTAWGEKRSFSGCLSAENSAVFNPAARSDKSILSNNLHMMTSLRQNGPLPSEVLYGVTSELKSPLFSLPYGFSVDEEELSGIIEKGIHRIYPSKAPLTVDSLVEWINSKGLNQPQITDDENGVRHIKVLREDAKFKKCRDVLSAMVMLRQLQCNSEKCSNGSGDDAPVFFFLGGGMAAGKSTAAMALSRSEWWEKHKANIVLVNADEFKVALAPFSDGEKSMHESSTLAAEKLMVEAVNRGRHIVFDSTMMWRPFVKQVIEMVRNAHTTLYQQGAGYKDNGLIEEYFKPLQPRSVPLPKPYEIRLAAITLEPEIAVPRGILRLFSTGRGVPIQMQLRSFRFFAENFVDYVDWVDAATLFNNNVFADLKKGELPPVLAEKTNEGLVIHDEEAYALFMRHRYLDEDADNILELYPRHHGDEIR